MPSAKGTSPKVLTPGHKKEQVGLTQCAKMNPNTEKSAIVSLSPTKCFYDEFVFSLFSNTVIYLVKVPLK